ncbi:MAG: DUF262 domain-containing protein [Acetatifactor sp.]|nr:DUF262 domain-containing protein [Acetatifactor sp.]
MAKPRKQTYTLALYLNKVKDFDIRNDADVQRQFVWNNEQINELIVTVLTEDYIPPIILGEEDNSQLWIVDGGQRTAALKKYRYGNYRITAATENSIIPYKVKARDEAGRVRMDEEGNIIWEDAFFDIKNKTYEKLPEELKKRMDEYQIDTVIHEHCDNHRISQLIKRYNNHTSMNTNQKAFTHIDNFARDIREIMDGRFFVDFSEFTESERMKGVVERVVVETVMCSNHLEDWKKQTKAACTYLNQNAEKAEFERLSQNLHRLEQVITEDVKSIFNSKDSFLFLTLFDRFAKRGLEDSVFVDFLREFKSHLRCARTGGVLFDEIDRDKGTKDRVVIEAKLNVLEGMLKKFLKKEGAERQKSGKDRVPAAEVLSGTGKEPKERKTAGTGKEPKERKTAGTGKEPKERKTAGTGKESKEQKAAGKQDGAETNKEASAESLVRDYVDAQADQEDIELFEIIANDVSEAVEDIESPLLSDENRPSFVALVGYAVKNDIDDDLKEWFADYEKRECTSDISDQRKSFLHMKGDLDRFAAGRDSKKRTAKP